MDAPIATVGSLGTFSTYSKPQFDFSDTMTSSPQSLLKAANAGEGGTDDRPTGIKGGKENVPVVAFLATKKRGRGEQDAEPPAAIDSDRSRQSKRRAVEPSRPSEPSSGRKRAACADGPVKKRQRREPAKIVPRSQGNYLKNIKQNTKYRNMRPDVDSIVDVIMRTTHCPSCNVQFLSPGKTSQVSDAIDHDHDLEKGTRNCFRARLCVRCNTSEGRLRTPKGGLYLSMENRHLLFRLSGPATLRTQPKMHCALLSGSLHHHVLYFWIKIKIKHLILLFLFILKLILILLIFINIFIFIFNVRHKI